MKLKLLFIILCMVVRLNGSEVNQVKRTDDEELASLLQEVSNSRPGHLGIFGAPSWQRKLCQCRTILTKLRSNEPRKHDYLVYDDGTTEQTQEIKNGLCSPFLGKSFEVKNGFEKGLIFYRIESDDQTASDKYIDEIRRLRKDNWSVMVSCSNVKTAHELHKTFSPDGYISKVIIWEQATSFYRSVLMVGMIVAAFIVVHRFLWRR